MYNLATEGSATRQKDILYLLVTFNSNCTVRYLRILVFESLLWFTNLVSVSSRTAVSGFNLQITLSNLQFTKLQSLIRWSSWLVCLFYQKHSIDSSETFCRNLPELLDTCSLATEPLYNTCRLCRALITIEEKTCNAGTCVASFMNITTFFGTFLAGSSSSGSKVVPE